MGLPLENDWRHVVGDEFEESYYKQLRTFLKEEYETKKIYPSMYDLFNALHLTSFANTKVVILGQDPYHGPEQAHGLSFSVQPGVSIPPSLRNIFKELESDLGCLAPENGNLTSWAEQGVLLLNTVLSVQEGTPASHQNKGWERFTDQVIRSLNQKEDPVVFLLWGKHAAAKARWLTKKHCIITTSHPSPFAAHRGFFGSRPFSQANEFLRSNGIKEVRWCLQKADQ
ncbi:LOW QUALITY PROTEIN: uracil-DNA glycosylase, family 1 [Geomicrobium sp. JCM 19039]|nr:LOW QUALITY PROTEIN: uracil-DNA glycosylase, family 1 [Geomicrobium sp. JCM 19039]